MNKIILKLRDEKQYKLMPIKKTCLKKKTKKQYPIIPIKKHV